MWSEAPDQPGKIVTLGQPHPDPRQTHTRSKREEEEKKKERKKERRKRDLLVQQQQQQQTKQPVSQSGTAVREIEKKNE